MEPTTVHISEADLASDITSILRQVETGVEVVIERDGQPIALLHAIAPVRPTISAYIALAKAHEEETGQAAVLDPDFAADVEELIRTREPWNPQPWD